MEDLEKRRRFDATLHDASKCQNQSNFSCVTALNYFSNTCGIRTLNKKNALFHTAHEKLKMDGQNMPDNASFNCLVHSCPDINRMAYYECSVVDRNFNKWSTKHCCDSQSSPYAMAIVPNTFLIITSSKFWQPVEEVIAAGIGFNEWCHPVCMWSLVQTVKMKSNECLLQKISSPFLKSCQ